jgi:hypothetical protein
MPTRVHEVGSGWHIQLMIELAHRHQLSGNLMQRSRQILVAGLDRQPTGHTVQHCGRVGNVPGPLGLVDVKSAIELPEPHRHILEVRGDVRVLLRQFERGLITKDTERICNRTKSTCQVACLGICPHVASNV